MRRHFAKPLVILLVILIVLLAIGVICLFVVKATSKKVIIGEFSDYAKEFGVIYSYQESAELSQTDTYSGLSRIIPSNFLGSNKAKQPCQSLERSHSQDNYALVYYSTENYQNPDRHALGPVGWEEESPAYLTSLIVRKQVGDKYICASIEPLGAGIPEEHSTGPSSRIVFYYAPVVN